MFVTAVRSKGDLAGVFEYAERTGYFYLYDRTGNEGARVLGAIYILSGTPDFTESEIEVRWAPGERMVGIIIRGQLWAAFSDREQFGGRYRPGAQPAIPREVAEAFSSAQ
jgi:hypothetical protein